MRTCLDEVCWRGVIFFKIELFVVLKKKGVETILVMRQIVNVNTLHQVESRLKLCMTKQCIAIFALFHYCELVLFRQLYYISIYNSIFILSAF